MSFTLKIQIVFPTIDNTYSHIHTKIPTDSAGTGIELLLILTKYENRLVVFVILDVNIKVCAKKCFSCALIVSYINECWCVCFTEYTTNMHIKSIVLDGFKSYGNRVEITGFDPEFNAITGLNGTGKSNILDSICFVLGITNLSNVSIV